MHRPIRRATGRALLAALAITLPLACGPTVTISPNPSGTPVPSSGPTSTPAVSATPVATEPSRGVARWSAVTPSGPAPASRAGHTWTVDPSSAVAYLFAGRGDGGDLGDVWAYDLTADAWRRLEPTGARPAPRREHAAAWIDGLGLVVFGGRTDTGVLDDFWAYDPGANAWRTLDVAGLRPGARAGACVAMRADGRLWLIGGQAADASALADVWVYDPGPSTWAPLPAVDEGPAGRFGAACWWTVDDRFVVYGGAGATAAVLGDAWFHAPAAAAFAWQPLATAGAAPRAGAAATVSGQGAVVVGGRGTDDAARSDLVTFDARSLVATSLDAASDGPAARSGATLVDDPEGERLIMFGGEGASGPFGDLWALDLP